MAVYQASLSDSHRASPHIKSYCCYRKSAIPQPSATKPLKCDSDDELEILRDTRSSHTADKPSATTVRASAVPEDRFELDWFLLTSSNVSQAAWGVLQSGNTSLYIKSYEIGVLFLPELVTTASRQFSCTPDHHLLGIDAPDSEVEKHRSYRFFCVADDDKEVSSISGQVYFPVPYKLDAPLYGPRDEPWVWDKVHSEPDVFGRQYRT
jgi:hypothetical protein